MDSAIGLVQRILWNGDSVLATVGPTPTTGVSVYTVFREADAINVTRTKRSVVNLLVRARNQGHPVEVRHDANLEIERVALRNADICLAGPAIHGDFFGVTGADIPADAKMVFENDATTVTLEPDLLRPHWFFVSALPMEVPLGRCTVRLVSSGWTSTTVPLVVSAAPPRTVRVLYSGHPKHRPFTIALVANAAIRSESGSIVADTTPEAGPAYRAVVESCLRSLLTMDEDILRQFDRDRQIRFLSVIDPSLAATSDNALAEELDATIMAPRRERMNGFLARYGIKADLVFVIYGSSTHFRNSAHPTTDSEESPETAAQFTYDAVRRIHGRFARTPGTVAIGRGLRGPSLMPLHEFGHAVSDFRNGRVRDLYVDSSPDGSFVVNKKWRSTASEPVPATFADYNGAAFLSDAGRDGLGYPPDWTSYHPELRSAFPNLMDTYSPANAGGPASRLDKVTYAWLSDRLDAKLRR